MEWAADQQASRQPVGEPAIDNAVTNELIGTARTTGLLYLGVAITGALGFLLIRPRDEADRS